MSDNAELQSEYPFVVSEIAKRLSVCEQMLSNLSSDPLNEDGWIASDLVSLQMRKTCEMMLLGSALAHLREGNSEVNPRKWRPKDSFNELSKVNQFPLPAPIELAFGQHPSGAKQILPASKPIPFGTISAIYGHCGDLLHVPSPARVLKGKISPFDIGKFVGWVEGLKRLIAGHVLMMPERKTILLCLWNGVKATPPSVYLMEADGPSTFNVDQLPDFSLLTP